MATVSELLAVARGEIGVKEDPADSNRVKYNTAYYGREVQGPAYPWCAAFLWWCSQKAGVAWPVKTASCGALRTAAQKVGQWVEAAAVLPGDIVLYDFGTDGAPDHCGVVEYVKNGTVTSIEGNTAPNNDANGGMVMRRVRPIRQVVGAFRPEYEEESVRYQHLSDVPETFRPVIEKLMDLGVIQGDGSDPNGHGDVIDLSHDMVRLLVMAYRAGAFGK